MEKQGRNYGPTETKARDLAAIKDTTTGVYQSSTKFSRGLNPTPDIRYHYQAMNFFFC